MSTRITAPDSAAPTAPGRFSPIAFWHLPRRSLAMGVSVLAAVLSIALMSAILSGRAAVLLLDKPSQHFVYPFTIQNLMHIVFFIGLAELYVRWRNGVREENFLNAAFL